MAVGARQKLKFSAVTGVLRGVLLQFNHEQIIASPFACAMMYHDVWHYDVCLSSVTLIDMFKSFSHLAIPVVFTVHIPRAAEMVLHVHGKTVSGRTFVNAMKFQWRRLSLQTFNCGSHSGLNFFVYHHRHSIRKRPRFRRRLSIL